MSAVITSPVMIVNAALKSLGVEQRIGNLYDGSKAAKAALDIYGQTRDEELRVGNWLFARRDVSLTLLKSSPAGGYTAVTWNPQQYPPLPWKYSYAYPSDCLKVRAVRPTQVFVNEYDPKPIPFGTPNDPYTGTAPDYVAAKVIVCNVAHAILTYTGQVTDPALWDVGFVDALIERLAKKLTPVLGSMQAESVEAAAAQASEARADATQG